MKKETEDFSNTPLPNNTICRIRQEIKGKLDEDEEIDDDEMPDNPDDQI